MAEGSHFILLFILCIRKLGRAQLGCSSLMHIPGKSGIGGSRDSFLTHAFGAWMLFHSCLFTEHLIFQSLSTWLRLPTALEVSGSLPFFYDVRLPRGRKWKFPDQFMDLPQTGTASLLLWAKAVPRHKARLIFKGVRRITPPPVGRVRSSPPRRACGMREIVTAIFSQVPSATRDDRMCH